MKWIISGFMLVLFMGCIGNMQTETGSPVAEFAENVSANDTAGQETEEPEGNETAEQNESIEKPVEAPEETPPAEVEPEEDSTHAIGQDGPERIYFDNGNYALIIEDVVWYGDSECAAVRIADSTDATLKKDVICPRQDYYWTTPEGHRYRMVISEVASGYSSGVSWAEVNIYG